MPMTKIQTHFPAGYDELEMHVAGLCACVDFTGNADPGDLGVAAFERLFREEIKKNPTVPQNVIAANFLTFVAKDMSFERVDLLGPPLRASWFVLAYFAWASIAAQCGRVSLEQAASSKIRDEMIAAMAELGVACSPEDCDIEIERFVPRRSAQNKGAPPSLRDIGYAAGVFIEWVHFLHLAALRHRTYVTPGFVEAGILVVATKDDSEVAVKIARYLVAHCVHISDGIERCRKTDQLLAVLSESSVTAPEFWGKVAESRRRGLRPIVLILCPRSRLDSLEASVPKAYRDDFEWLKATAVVEFESDNMRGCITILRALEPTTRWWWRDDAIPWTIGIDPFSMFDAVAARRKTRLAKRRPYPAIAQQHYIEDAFRLARLGADKIVAQGSQNPGEEWTPEEEYREACHRLWVHRRTFPDGYFRLPWFLIAYHTMLRVLLSAPASGERTAWQGADIHLFQKALFSLGIGSQLSVLPTMFRDFVKLPWTRDIGDPEGPLERARGFIVLIEALSEAALDCGRKVGLQFPLRSSFVSYASAERDLARALVTFLEGRNVADVWWDQNSISMGGMLTETLRAGIASSERFVLVASEASVSNRYVRLELEAALEMEKPIVVVSPGRQLCPEWLTKLDELRAEGRPIGPVLTSGGDIETSGPALLAALTRDPEERLAWLAGRSSSFGSGSVTTRIRKKLTSLSAISTTTATASSLAGLVRRCLGI